MTIQEREALRAVVLQKYGRDYLMPEAVRDQIVAEVEPNWIILREEFTGHRLTLAVTPKLAGRRLMDAEAALGKKYGWPPYTYWTDFTQYRLTFGVN